MSKPLSIAIIGAGIGGLAVASLLRRAGCEVNVYEQAPRVRARRRRHPDGATATNSSKNTWLRSDTDPAWVYGYDAWSVPLGDTK